MVLKALTILVSHQYELLDNYKHDLQNVTSQLPYPKNTYKMLIE